MDFGVLLTVATVVLATLAIWLLPLRRRWNDDGRADAQREALAAHVQPGERGQ